MFRRRGVNIGPAPRAEADGSGARAAARIGASSYRSSGAGRVRRLSITIFILNRLWKIKALKQRQSGESRHPYNVARYNDVIKRDVRHRGAFISWATGVLRPRPISCGGKEYHPYQHKRGNITALANRERGARALASDKLSKGNGKAIICHDKIRWLRTRRIGAWRRAEIAS